jgi:mRNA interferase RelE/StbE
VSRKVVFTRTARRQLSGDLPEPIAAAAWELIQGDLRDKPQIVGKPLMEPYAGDWTARRGTYQIRYRFDDKDDKTVTILAIKPRSTAYQA